MLDFAPLRVSDLSGQSIGQTAPTDALGGA